MDLIDIVKKPTGHEVKGLTNKQWLAKKSGAEIHGNGKIPFSIPEGHHKRISVRYYFAKKARTLSKLYVEIGAEFGGNGGTADIKGVTKYVKVIVKAQGGEV